MPPEDLITLTITRRELAALKAAAQHLWFTRDRLRGDRAADCTVAAWLPDLKRALDTLDSLP